MIRIFFTSLFIGFVLASAYISYKTPQYDWDMLAYSAIYHQSIDSNEVHTHQYVYDTLITSLPAATQSFLIDKPNEVACARNSYFFAQQIPFYTIKPGYNLLIKIITPLVSSPLKAMRLISVCSYMVICLIIWLWLGAYIEHTWACLASVCISALPLLIEQGRLFTPDALSTLITLTSLYLLYEKKKQYPAFLLLVLSVFVRPDNILLIILIAAFTLYRSYAYLNKINIPAIVMVCAAIAFYIIISLVYHGYGWSITFMHSVIDISMAPAYWIKNPLAVSLYLKYVAIGFSTFKMRWIYAFFLFSLSYFSIKKSNHRQKLLFEILAVLSILMILKFFIFPIFDDRYFAVQYLFAMMAICMVIFPRKEKPLSPRVETAN